MVIPLPRHPQACRYGYGPPCPAFPLSFQLSFGPVVCHPIKCSQCVSTARQISLEIWLPRPDASFCSRLWPSLCHLLDPALGPRQPLFHGACPPQLPATLGNRPFLPCSPPLKDRFMGLPLGTVSSLPPSGLVIWGYLAEEHSRSIATSSSREAKDRNIWS